MKNKILISFLIFFLTIPVYGLCSNKAYLVYSMNKKKIIESSNIKKQLIPASTLKILTSLIAIEKLGLDYRFKTEFYFDGKNNLILKGHGDPLFISSEIKRLAKIIAEKGNSKIINNIYLDQSFFLQKSINFNGTLKNSIQPYDSPNNSIAANFNSVCFRVRKNKFISCEKETPVLNEILPLIKNSGLKFGRIPITQKNNLNLLYPGYLLKYFLGENGITIKGRVKTQTIKTDKFTKNIFISSFTLKDIIEKMLFYSNNFIANQLFLSIGNDSPKSIKSSIKEYEKYLKKNKIKAKIIEGSGISRANKISAENLLKLLLKFKKHYKLLKSEENKYFYKTGTLYGVRNICGYYIKNPDDIYIFVILNNNSNTPQEAAMRKLIKQVL